MSQSISGLSNSSSQRLKTQRLLWAASLREPVVRLPRQPALYHPKREWRLPEQEDPEEYLAETRSHLHLSLRGRTRSCRYWKIKPRAGKFSNSQKPMRELAFRTLWSLPSARRGRTSQTQWFQPGCCLMVHMAYRSTAEPASVTKNVLPQ